MKAILEIIKENKLQVIIISCLLAVLAFSISYAAFYKSGAGTAQTGNIGTLNITYTDGETLNFENSLPLLEEEVLEYAPSYSFSVKNTGDIVAYAEISLTNLVIHETLRTDENFRWALYEGTTKVSEGNFQNATTTLSLKKNVSIATSATKTYTLRVWINDNNGDQNHLLNKTMTGKITATATNRTVATTFDYSGVIETYTVPTTGNYRIEAAGAEGTSGNDYSLTTVAPAGGKGATISATFSLNSGDVLYIVTGGKGSVTSATDKNGTSGAGGGGSFVFKKISEITDSSYQFQKGSDYFETLLVAAGGGGSNDASENSSSVSGADGVGATWVSVGGASYSTTTATGTSSSLYDVLGISQFISYDSAGAVLIKNNGVCKGGFGGGGCADVNQSRGGGWINSGSSADRSAKSFSSGTSTSGTTGSRSGNGYVKIALNG